MEQHISLAMPCQQSLLPYIQDLVLLVCMSYDLMAPLHILQVAYGAHLQARHKFAKHGCKPGVNMARLIVRCNTAAGVYLNLTKSRVT